MKRIFDIVAAAAGLLLFSPVFLAVSAFIKAGSKGPVFFVQKRTGYKGAEFKVIKFRTMVTGAERLGSSVTSSKDPRITGIGRFLRNTKLDELPQLVNILKGDMSFVGPRPDVPEITANYTEEMKKIFDVRPGLTSKATIFLRDEEELLSRSDSPDEFYERVLVPLKVELAMEHVNRKSLMFDIGVLLQTLWVLSPMNAILPLKEPPSISDMKSKLG